jgi:HEAT repeat protein
MSWWDRLTQPAALLRHSAWERRERIVEIHEAGDLKSAGLLIFALADEDDSVRRAAAEALGDIRTPEAAGPLAELLGQSGVGEVAARSLVRYGQDGADAALEKLTGFAEFMDAAHVAGALKDRRAVAALVARLGENYTGDVARDALAAIGPASLPALAGAMAHEDQHVRLDAVRAVESIGGGEVRDLLVRALDDASDRVREVAMVAVGTHGGAAAVPHLARLLRSAPEIEKWSAVDGLAATGAAEAVAPLLRCLESDADDEYLMGRVVTALGRLKDPAAIGPLRPFLGRGPLELRKTVLGVLEDLGWRPASDEDRGLAAAARGDYTGLGAIGPAAAGPLADLLTGSWEMADKQAALDGLLTVMGGGAADVPADVLIRLAALGRLEGAVPFTAYRDSWDDTGYTDWMKQPLDCGDLAGMARAELLRRRDPDRGESALIDELSADLPLLRREAARELAGHATPGVLAALARAAVHDDDGEVAAAAARSLAGHGEPGFYALHPYLAARDGETRVNAVAALAHFPASAALAGLGQVVNDQDDEVCEAVLEQLLAIEKDAAIPVLMRVLAYRKRRHRKRAVEALVARGEAAVPMLLEALDGAERRVRYSVLGALEAIAPAAAAGPLLGLLDADPRYARAVVSALGAILSRHAGTLDGDTLRTLAGLADQTQRGWRADEPDEPVDCGAIRMRAQDALLER